MSQVDGREVETPREPTPRVEERWGPFEPDPLHICFHCRGELVYALDWMREDARTWRMLLRCPDCGATREGSFGHDAVEALNDELDYALACMVKDLRALTHSNMQEEIAFFVRALHTDLIGPSDF